MEELDDAQPVAVDNLVGEGDSSIRDELIVEDEQDEERYKYHYVVPGLYLAFGFHDSHLVSP